VAPGGRLRSRFLDRSSERIQLQIPSIEAMSLAGDGMQQRGEIAALV